MMPSRSRKSSGSAGSLKIYSHNQALAMDLMALAKASIDDLRKRYVEIFRCQPPQSFGPDLLRKSIAQEIQCRAHGAIPRSVEDQLRALSRHRQQSTHGRIDVARKINVGSEFARTWKGKMHRVVVLAHGYAYAGKTYRSLSEIARSIAGSRWNGPRFFGLRGKVANGS